MCVFPYFCHIVLLKLILVLVLRCFLPEPQTEHASCLNVLTDENSKFSKSIDKNFSDDFGFLPIKTSTASCTLLFHQQQKVLEDVHLVYYKLALHLHLNAGNMQ